MAVDTKQVLGRNKPLIVCYLLALVPIGLWVALVLFGVKGGKRQSPPSFDDTSKELASKKAKLKQLFDRIKAMDPNKRGDNDVLTEKHIDEFNKRNEVLKEQHRTMYETLKKHDVALEEWFDKFKGKKTDPAEGEFNSTFTDEITKLQEGVFKDLVTDPEKTNFLYTETAKKDTVRLLQKRFWIQKAVLTGLKSGGAKRLLETITFVRPTGVAGSDEGGDEKTRLISYVWVRAVFSARFRDVPKITHELLSQDIVMRLVKVRTEPLPFSLRKGPGDPDLPDRDRWVVNPTPLNVYPLDPPFVLLRGKDSYGNDEKWLPEPDLRVTCDLEAFDFEMDRIPAPPAPPAEPPK